MCAGTALGAKRAAEEATNDEKARAEARAAANAVPEAGDDEPEVNDAVVLPPRRDRRASAAEVLSKEAQRQLEWAMAE